MIIALAGPIGSGKNTVADIFVNQIDTSFTTVSFASKVKEIVSVLTGLSLFELEDRKIKVTPLTGQFKGYTPRTLIIKIAESMKDSFGKDVWSRALMETYDNFQGSLIHSYVPVKNGYIDITERMGKITAVTHLYHKTIPFSIIDNRIKLEVDLDIEAVAVSYYESIRPNFIITDLRFNEEAEAVKERGGLIVKVNRFDLEIETEIKDYPFDAEINNNGTIVDLKNEIRNKLGTLKYF